MEQEYNVIPSIILVLLTLAMILWAYTCFRESCISTNLRHVVEAENLVTAFVESSSSDSTSCMGKDDSTGIQRLEL